MRRLLTTTLLCASLVVACSDDEDPTIAVDASTTTVPAAPGEQAAPPTTQADQAVESPPTTVVAGEPAPAAPESPQQESAANGNAGSFARGILAGDGTILVEVIAQDGALPRAGTLEHVAGTLQEVSGKPTSATVETASTAEDGSWTADELRAIADAQGTPQGEDRVVLHLVFVHGRWHESDTVLGVAVRGDTAAVFVDAVDEAASPLVGAGAIEEAATMHEVGHLLGLVDLFLDTGRADPEHPGHSANRNSVMYWAVESTLITDVLAGGPPRELDADDLRDLATIRG